MFAAGFILGTIRVLLVAPHVGTRSAELLELPVMLTASVPADRWTNRRSAAEAGPSARIGIGLLALGLLFGAEVTVGVTLRGASPAEAVLNRDPASGAAY